MPTLYYTFSKGSSVNPCQPTLSCAHRTLSYSHRTPLFYRLFFSQTSITVKIDLDPDTHSYTLAWKQYPQTWKDAASAPILAANTQISMDATDLLPATTYCLRIQNDSGQFGEELIVDTEAVNCTPQTKCCCIVQWWWIIVRRHMAGVTGLVGVVEIEYNILLVIIKNLYFPLLFCTHFNSHVVPHRISSCCATKMISSSRFLTMNWNIHSEINSFNHPTHIHGPNIIRILCKQSRDIHLIITICDGQQVEALQWVDGTNPMMAAFCSLLHSDG